MSQASRTIMRLAVIACAWAWGAGAPVFAAEAPDPIRWEPWGVREGLADNAVNAICPAADGVYIGTRKGLSVFNRQRRQFAVIGPREGLPQEMILALKSDGARVWIGTGQGLAVWEKGRAQLMLEAEHPLSHLAITALAQQGDTLYVGTAQGLYACSLKARTAAPVAGVPEQSIVDLKLAGPYLLIVGAPDRLSLLDLKTQAVETLSMMFNPLHSPVTGAGAQGDFLWFITDGSGLIGHNLMTRDWVSLNRASSSESNYSALAPSGDTLWVGGFSGVSRYQTLTGQWQVYPNQQLADTPLTALAVDGEWLWVGTSGGGAFQGRVRSPQLATRLVRRFFRNEEAVWSGTASGDGALTGRLEYQSAGAAAERWQGKYASFALTRQGFQARLDFRRLPDGQYRVRETVRGANGKSATETFTLAKETKPIALTFEAGPIRSGRVEIGGAYHPADVERIVVEPGKIPAVLDRAQGRFRVELPLTAGRKTLRFRATDRAGHTREFVYALAVSDPPRIALAASAGTFTPGYDVVQFKVQQESLGEVEEWNLLLTTAAGSQVKTQTGRGELPPLLTWDGCDDAGNTVAAEQVYLYALQVKEKSGWQMTTPARVLRAMGPGESRESLIFKLGTPVLFDPGETEIKPAFLAVFAALQALHREHPAAMLLIEGHADDRPIRRVFPTNQALSEARAQAVSDYITRNGLAEARFITRVGYGASRPAQSNKTRAGRLANRRVEIMLIEK